jgi:hypothetical protein
LAFAASSSACAVARGLAAASSASAAACAASFVLSRVRVSTIAARDVVERRNRARVFSTTLKSSRAARTSIT